MMGDKSNNWSSVFPDFYPDAYPEKVKEPEKCSQCRASGDLTKTILYYGALCDNCMDCLRGRYD